MSTAQAVPAATIKVLASKTLHFGIAGSGLVVEAKTTIQDVPAYIIASETFKAASRDGSIVVITGKSTVAPLLVPPTIEEVIAQRGCSSEEAAKIVEIETLRSKQGEFPYPAIGTVPEPVAAAPVVAAEPAAFAPPTVETLVANGYSQKDAARIVKAFAKGAANGAANGADDGSDDNKSDS